ncbi:AAA family ATPase [Streptomyces sp. NPDC001219]
MDAVAADVLSGRPHVVQLEGSAGIGKSALLNTWWERNGQFRVLRARCHPLERQFAFGAVRQLFKPLLAAASAGDRAGLLEGIAAVTLRALDDTAGAGPLPEAADVTASTLRELDALVARLSRRQPLLLAVDALQWIDQPSLRWLVHFVGRADSHPVLIAVTTRSAESRRLDPLFAELVRPANCHTLVVEPLGVADVGQLVRTLWGADEPDEAFCAACHAATGGHPLFVRALLHQAQRTGVKPTTEFRDRIPTVTLSTLGGEISHRLCQASGEVVELRPAQPPADPAGLGPRHGAPGLLPDGLPGRTGAAPREHRRGARRGTGRGRRLPRRPAAVRPDRGRGQDRRPARPGPGRGRRAHRGHPRPGGADGHRMGTAPVPHEPGRTADRPGRAADGALPAPRVRSPLRGPGNGQPGDVPVALARGRRPSRPGGGRAGPCAGRAGAGTGPALSASPGPRDGAAGGGEHGGRRPRARPAGRGRDGTPAHSRTPRTRPRLPRLRDRAAAPGRQARRPQVPA